MAAWIGSGGTMSIQSIFIKEPGDRSVATDVCPMESMTFDSQEASLISEIEMYEQRTAYLDWL